jgi:hypothetical protein
VADANAVLVELVAQLGLADEVSNGRLEVTGG